MDEHGSSGRVATVPEDPAARHARAAQRRSARVRRQALGLGMLVAILGPAWAAFREPAVAGVEPPATDLEEVEEAESETAAVSILEIEAHVREVATRHGLSPLLVAAIIEAESEFNPRAVSRKGARGLMQLMP
ncbi:MAG TPA: transglycosylase SLT domain-containing protein, partial [Candidatus Tectomicrobia bacterium]|nr:transglycosylase SLT domain-containing protein [Candidatus Tectomicrobia bacterium]